MNHKANLEVVKQVLRDSNAKADSNIEHQGAYFKNVLLEQRKDEKGNTFTFGIYRTGLTNYKFHMGFNAKPEGVKYSVPQQLSYIFEVDRVKNNKINFMCCEHYINDEFSYSEKYNMASTFPCKAFRRRLNYFVENYVPVLGSEKAKELLVKTDNVRKNLKT